MARSASMMRITGLLLAACLLAGCTGDEAPPAQTKQASAEPQTTVQTDAPAAQPAGETGAADYIECKDLARLQAEQLAEATSESGLSAALQTTFDRTCKMCHTNPAAGAPQLGDAAAWAPRLAQGRELLLDHTIDGYRGMPPLGLCMACGEDEFVALIEYMAGSPLPATAGE